MFLVATRTGIHRIYAQDLLLPSVPGALQALDQAVAMREESHTEDGRWVFSPRIHPEC